ncbi:MAG: PIN domain-containing protein, partial [Cyanobium sp.]
MTLRPRYLLDTNICIYLMKHQPPQVVERFSASRVGEVLISAITAAELEYGVVASGP